MKNLLLILAILFISSSAVDAQKVKLESKPNENKVDVYIGNDLFTSYIYPETIKKPVLWPVVTAGGNEITRQYPLKNKAGERVDHPHHVGVWFNYGDVNGLDFWNNSDAISSEKADKYGTIYHEKIEKVESGKKEGELVTTASWKDNAGKTLLNEQSEFTFAVDGDTRIIDRCTYLKANGQVKVTDNKEGMFAIRVTRELELPATGKLKLVDSHGNVTEVDAAEGNVATGNYLSSEGVTGSEVWATRARWMKLSGVVNGEQVAVVIFDHPGNPGYPTYWHARGYGLFSANTLGQEVFSEGKERMNFVLEDGETATFRYRLAVFSGDPTERELNIMAEEFQDKI